MPGKLDYSIIKNKPNFGSNGQYYFNPHTESWHFETGLESIAIGDDLYTIQTDYLNLENAWFTWPNTSGGLANSGDLIVDMFQGGQIPEPTAYIGSSRDFRFISNVYVGAEDSGVYVQKYHELGSYDYVTSSSPNVVNLTFDIALNDGSFYPTYIQSEDMEDAYTYVQDIDFDFFVINWDWKEGDPDFVDFDFPTSSIEHDIITLNDSILIVGNALMGDTLCPPNIMIGDGRCHTVQKQYHEPGIKHIKAIGLVIDRITGDIKIKFLDIRIFLGLDNVFVEDFSDIGGPDFIFLPWPYEMTPVIGGIAKKTDYPKYRKVNSQYIKSLNKLIKANQFSNRDVINKALAQKSHQNEFVGVWPGKLDFAQTRVFAGNCDGEICPGEYDLAKLLMIEDAYEMTLTANNKLLNHPYSDSFYWDGFINKFPEDSCVGEIFISDNKDLILRSKTIFEFNGGEAEISSIRDSSGNGNKAILFGDYSIMKGSKELPLSRQTDVDYPDTDTKDGAL